MPVMYADGDEPDCFLLICHRSELKMEYTATDRDLSMRITKIASGHTFRFERLGPHFLASL